MFSSPPTFRRRRYTGRRLQGVRYERAAHEHLENLYGDWYLASPWLRFLSDGRWRWCQPDALLFKPLEGKITIIECKYQHTSDAWWQVRHLYQPVLEHIFPAKLWTYEACEVVKWYDPAVPFPERTVMANEVDMAHSAFKIHIWKP